MSSVSYLAQALHAAAAGKKVYDRPDLLTAAAHTLERQAEQIVAMTAWRAEQLATMTDALARITGLTVRDIVGRYDALGSPWPAVIGPRRVVGPRSGLPARIVAPAPTGLAEGRDSA